MEEIHGLPECPNGPVRRGREFLEREGVERSDGRVEVDVSSLSRFDFPAIGDMLQLLNVSASLRLGPFQLNASVLPAIGVSVAGLLRVLWGRLRARMTLPEVAC